MTHRLRWTAGAGDSWRLPLVIWFVTVVLFASCKQFDPTGGSYAVTPSSDSAPRDHSVLVVVHSWTGRTATVGEEIAAMLGGRIVRISASPFMKTPNDARASQHVAAELGRLDGVRDIYLGFPVWSEEPSWVIRELVDHLDLTGIRVIPFYTFLHFVSPQALESLRDALAARGAQVGPAMAFRLRMNASAEEVRIRTRRALLERPELWAVTAPEAVQDCQNGRCAIPAGKVWIGDTGLDAPPGAAPPRLYAVDAFAIDQGEVTVGAYKRCIAAGACPEIAVSTLGFCTELIKGGDQLPQPCASFSEAEAYCRWDGGRLPTEAEWMRAGRGQTTSVFPWGDRLDLHGNPLRGNFGEKPSTGYEYYATVAESDTWPADGHPGLAPPCSFPAGHSPFGVCDLEGNLSEWVTSDTAIGSSAVLGGSWLDGEVDAFRLGLRYATYGTQPSNVAQVQMGFFLIGFRCVRAAAQPEGQSNRHNR